ncbi:murein hydrolase activator EnvC family protein [Polycladidibacter stylochi]|uniref:murein hydrolase activator EnvC family protein n=1 Tax=Polycladidibacter stylochi TaxID=1807766 RepID=UPI001AD927C3|nr:peptidoglycan DD-metalloendopeptidase family protein [Pseudovibrio stylochi]
MSFLAVRPSLAAKKEQASLTHDFKSEQEKALKEKEAREKELLDLTRDISISEEKKAQIEREIRTLDRDKRALNGELIRSGEKLKQLESQLALTESRLARHRHNEDKVRASLNARRDVLAEVLSALQRIGHRPPPALAVHPQDALSAVRSAILLNAVMPELRVEAEALASDLNELTSLRSKIEDERNRYRSGAQQLAEERQKMQALLSEKEKQSSKTAAQLEQERMRLQQLAAKATSLKELLATIEQQMDSAKSAANAARKAAEERKKHKDFVDPYADPGRLSPQIAFAKAKGLLPLPVSGSLLQDYGVADGFGNKTNGQSIVTGPNAQVTSPTDGWVAFAGAFRSYGQMVIINAGDGYLVLLAGMDHINVELGQFVLAGEPVARMGETRLASVNALNFNSTAPVLYIEFRKDGNAINPKSWWAGGVNKKVRG